MVFAPLEFRSATLRWTRTYIVGVVNVTPDSFSDGGQFFELDAAVRRGLELVAEGADIIDVGGESTRPVGARSVDAAEEIERVVPVIRALRNKTDTIISIDTTKAEVAKIALEAGAEVVNDISGGLFEPAIIEVAAAAGATYVCGHVRGRTLAEVHAAEADPPNFAEVANALAARVSALPAVLRSRTVVNPGLGFGKGTAENIELIRRSGELSAALCCPAMVGPSRKRFLGDLTGRSVDHRDSATVGASLAAVASGVHFVRVHDVKLLKSALVVYEAVRGDVG